MTNSVEQLLCILIGKIRFTIYALVLRPKPGVSEVYERIGLLVREKQPSEDEGNVASRLMDLLGC